MQPPEDVNTTFFVPASLAEWRILREPITFTIASWIGSATEARTSTWAARCMITSGSFRRTSSPTAVEVTSMRWKENFPTSVLRAPARFAREPEDRSSTPMTSSPSASR